MVTYLIAYLVVAVISYGILCYLMDAPHNRRYNVGHKRLRSLKELAR